jgi:hypothetical protein
MAERVRVCGECLYFEASKTNLGTPTGSGECHRYAPRPLAMDGKGGEWYWPYLSAGAWCGEFQPRGEEG